MTAASFLWWPALACLLSGLALVLSGVTLTLLRRERMRPPEAALPDPALSGALTELAAHIGQLRIRLEEVEQRKAPLSDWAAAEPTALNLNRRGQVLRLYRRGDSVAHIASSLGLSTGEVALIVKVQEMSPPGRGQENAPGEL